MFIFYYIAKNHKTVIQQIADINRLKENTASNSQTAILQLGLVFKFRL